MSSGILWGKKSRDIKRKGLRGTGGGDLSISK